MWIFAEKSPRHKARNPLSDEFFDSPETLTDVSALVRESIQNSLDARLDQTQPVTVSFRIGSTSKENLAPITQGLKAHLDIALGKEPGALLGGTCNYLVVEDFNCTGLTGSTKQDMPDPDLPGDQQSYTYFVHVEGDSGKGSGKGGKWGVGKIVFPKLSQIKTYFILTSRLATAAPEGNMFIGLGQSITKFHRLGGVHYEPDGWLAQVGENGLFEPTTNESAEAIASAFDIDRVAKPGLSVAIPYISDSIKIESFRDAVIRQYFIPVLLGNLICTFSDGTGVETVVDKSSLKEFVKKINPILTGRNDRSSEEMLLAIEVMEEYINGMAITLEHSVSKQDINSRRPHFDEDGLIALARDHYDSERTICLEVSVVVPVGGSTREVPDIFRVLLKKSPDLRSSPLYSREGILVANKKIATPNTLVVVLVESGPLADLLGSAEGPAHMEWSSGTQKFKRDFGNSSYPALILPMIKGYPSKFIEALVSKSGSFDSDLLADLLNFDDSSEDIEPGPRPGPNPGPNPNPPPLKPIPPRRPALVNVTPIEGGFRISPSSSSTLGSGDTFRVRVAYQVRRGNPFSKYSPYDFEINKPDQFGFTYKNCEATAKSGNSVTIKLSAEAFSFELLGFDALRDVEVEVTPLERNDEIK
jgi:hypothetical protein